MERRLAVSSKMRKVRRQTPQWFFVCFRMCRSVEKSGCVCLEGSKQLLRCMCAMPLLTEEEATRKFRESQRSRGSRSRTPSPLRLSDTMTAERFREIMNETSSPCIWTDTTVQSFPTRVGSRSSSPSSARSVTSWQHTSPPEHPVSVTPQGLRPPSTPPATLEPLQVTPVQVPMTPVEMINPADAAGTRDGPAASSA